MAVFRRIISDCHPDNTCLVVTSLSPVPVSLHDDPVPVRDVLRVLPVRHWFEPVGLCGSKYCLQSRLAHCHPSLALWCLILTDDVPYLRPTRYYLEEENAPCV